MIFHTLLLLLLQLRLLSKNFILCSLIAYNEMKAHWFWNSLPKSCSKWCTPTSLTFAVILFQILFNGSTIRCLYSVYLLSNISRLLCVCGCVFQIETSCFISICSSVLKCTNPISTIHFVFVYIIWQHWRDVS